MKIQRTWPASSSEGLAQDVVATAPRRRPPGSTGGRSCPPTVTCPRSAFRQRASSPRSAALSRSISAATGEDGRRHLRRGRVGLTCARRPAPLAGAHARLRELLEAERGLDLLAPEPVLVGEDQMREGRAGLRRRRPRHEPQALGELSAGDAVVVVDVHRVHRPPLRARRRRAAEVELAPERFFASSAAPCWLVLFRAYSAAAVGRHNRSFLVCQ